jgi:uncharacterized protein YecE (DUF72 family)
MAFINLATRKLKPKVWICVRGTMRIHVGCCGWARGRGEYFRSFSAVEIQSTFYRLPKLDTAARWREEAPEGFIHCMKAWQALTHPPTSPTWRRSGMKPEELQLKRFGWLRPTRDNLKAWEQTKEVCDVLGTKVCVLQCPPGFKFTRENADGMRKFFSKIHRGELLLAWEPRGNWHEHPEEIEKLCGELELIHVVDPLRTEALAFGPDRIAYFRLHGFGKPSIYNYRYSDAELKRLARIFKELRVKEIFCMFNNLNMFEDASRLQRVLSRS